MSSWTFNDDTQEDQRESRISRSNTKDLAKAFKWASNKSTRCSSRCCGSHKHTGQFGHKHCVVSTRRCNASHGDVGVGISANMWSTNIWSAFSYVGATFRSLKETFNIFAIAPVASHKLHYHISTKKKCAFNRKKKKKKCKTREQCANVCRR